MKRASILLLCSFFYLLTLAQQSQWPLMGGDSINGSGLKDHSSGQVGEGRYTDNLPVISIENAVIMGGENGACYMVLLLSLSKRSKDPVKVQYQTMSSTTTQGEDYLQKKGSIIFPANRLLQTIKVQVDCDAQNKGHETFLVKLSEAVNATPVQVSVTGTIHNNVPLSAVSFNNRLFSESKKEAAIAVSTNQ
jgi:hypothetical protein